MNILSLCSDFITANYVTLCLSFCASVQICTHDLRHSNKSYWKLIPLSAQCKYKPLGLHFMQFAIDWVTGNDAISTGGSKFMGDLTVTSNAQLKAGD